jgi:hypothetical protein
MSAFDPIEHDQSLVLPGNELAIVVRPGAVPTGIDWDAAAVRIADYLRANNNTFPEGGPRGLFVLRGREISDRRWPGAGADGQGLQDVRGGSCSCEGVCNSLLDEAALASLGTWRAPA